MNLDDFGQMNAIDPARMILNIRALPDQIMEAWEAGKSIHLPDLTGISQVYLAGIGSSYTAAQLLKGYLSYTCSIPVQVVCDFELPASARDRQTLLVISGHDGNECELPGLLASGIQAGCRMVVLAMGGKLIDLARKNEIPYVTYSHKGPARTALAYQFFLSAAVLSKTGEFVIRDEDVRSVADLLSRTRDQIDVDVPVVKNPAKRMAGQFLNRWITLLASGYMEAVAQRWKSQIHENAKAWAQVEKLPLICHSTMGGILNPENQLSQMMTLFLQSDCDQPINLAISDEARKMFMVEGFNTDYYLANGANLLECMWNAIIYGDYISYYLAMAYGVDPTPVPGVEEIEYFLTQI
jgi:glucose/mannose-6-phosphate isomerase